MTEILPPDEVDVLRRTAERTSSTDVAGSFLDAIVAVCDSHEALRTQLAEADSKAESARVIRRVSTAERVAEIEELRADLDEAVLDGDLRRVNEMYLDARLREAVRLLRDHADVCSRFGEPARLRNEADRLDPLTEGTGDAG